MQDEDQAGVPPQPGHLLNLYALALADLTLDYRELELLFLIGERIGLNRSDIQNILLNPQDLNENLPASAEGRIAYLYDFAQMVWSDGEIDESERELLERFCTNFGFEPENASEITSFLLSHAERNTPLDSILEIVSANS